MNESEITLFQCSAIPILSSKIVVYDTESWIRRYATAYNHDQLLFRTVLESFRHGRELPRYN
jgi:hypothetical protein